MQKRKQIWRRILLEGEVVYGHKISVLTSGDFQHKTAILLMEEANHECVVYQVYGLLWFSNMQ